MFLTSLLPVVFAGYAAARNRWESFNNDVTLSSVYMVRWIASLPPSVSLYVCVCVRVFL